jgi:hypothetical protein
MLRFDLQCKWDNEGVDLYINRGTNKQYEKVGRIPKGVCQATLNAVAPSTVDGKEIDLFKYILIPNYEERSMIVRMINGVMEVVDYEITGDTKNIKIVKEK